VPEGAENRRPPPALRQGPLPGERHLAPRQRPGDRAQVEDSLRAADVIELYFTRGVYAVFPISIVYDFSSGSNITPVPTGP
jgi:hypothetical protein